MLTTRIDFLKKIHVAILVCSLSCAPVFGIDQADIMRRAANSYYVLKAQGLKDFHCTVVPNSKALSDTLKIGPDNPNFKLLSDLQFSVSVDEYNRWTITPFLVSGGDIDHRFDELVGGLRTMIDGVYQAWVNMVVTNPLGGLPSNAKVTEEQRGYRISSSANGINTEILLSQDYAITEVNVSSENSRSTSWPTFIKTDKGFLLTSLKTSLNNGQRQLSMDFEYETIGGFSMPTKLVAKMPASGQVITIEMAFSNYQINKMP